MTTTRNVTLSLVLLALSLLAWEAVVRVLQIQAFILPPPSQVVVALYRGFASGLYVKHLQVTLLESAMFFFRRDGYLQRDARLVWQIAGRAGTCLAPYECTIPIEK